MNKNIEVLVHGYQAHLDEVMAATLIAIHTDYEVNITRDSNIKNTDGFDYILDTGMKFDGIKFFDHHQDDENVNGKSAAGLVYDTFFSHIKGDLETLVERINFQDNNGLSAYAETIGSDSKTLTPLLTIEKGLVKLFETQPDMVINTIMVPMVKGIIDNYIATEKAKQFIEDNSIIEHIGNVNVLKLTKKFDGPAYVLNMSQVDYVDQNDIHVVYSYDDRTAGRVLFRTHRGESQNIDFTKSTPADTVFIHKAGFMCKFNPATDTEYIQLIKQSVGADINE